MEDATDIILNLKQIPIKLHSDETKTLYLRADKAGAVKAADLEVDAAVEILDPDLHVATVADGGSLHMEMRVKQGRGYVSAEKNFDDDLGIGWIPVDSVHSPVRRVQLPRGSGPSRSDDRLRQAHRRRVDRRLGDGA